MRFFASLRMTVLKSLIIKCTNVLHSGLAAPISQKPSAKLALVEKGQTASDQLTLKEYQLYLPPKELLRQKLLDWTREQEGKA